MPVETGGMNMLRPPSHGEVTANEAWFIKLGRNGCWEEECLRDGILRFGYFEASHNACLEGNWNAVRQAMLDLRGNQGTATSDTNQIKRFYQLDEMSLFITFCNGQMYWCRPQGPVTYDPSSERKARGTVDGWHSSSLAGRPLSIENLSGNLLKVQRFQGTICCLNDHLKYISRKLNDKTLPEVSAALAAERDLEVAIIGLMRLLTWQDFELLVDLVFAESGWRRIGVVGRTQKTVDLELLQPITNERAFVQIKSCTRINELQDYIDTFTSAERYDRMFFVWHTGAIDLDILGVTLIGPKRLAHLVQTSGLATWLREKVS
ncbi:MAG: hypothetical protein ACR2RE_24685 [Geminicoccaceae bacterium]